MKYRQTDMQDDAAQTLASLRALPRPVYGHATSLANQAIGYRHAHPWMQLSYAVKGVLQIWTESGRYAAPPLFAVWIPEGVQHRVQCGPGTEIRSLYIAPEAIPAIGRQCRVVAVTPLLRELIRAFSEFPAEYETDGAQGRLVDVLLDQLAAAPDSGLTLPWPDDTRLRKLCACLQRDPDSKKPLARFSTELAVSEKTLTRLFLKETGLNFRQWRQRLRLLASLPLLEQGMRVTDVAIACGYDSMSAYIAAFHAQMGATPRELFPHGHSG